MIDRTFFLFLALLLGLPKLAMAGGAANPYPIPDGFARLVVERSGALLLLPQNALIALNGRPIGNLQRDAKLQLDLAPGTWRISARTRATAEQSVLAVKLKANAETRVRVELDPARFPTEGSVSGIGNLARQAFDAPNDDRAPLFVLREVVPETPEGER